MTVRLTESRLPSGFSAMDLGQATTSSDGHAALVSYYHTPVVRGRKQTYVLFVLDAGLRGRVANYRWQVREIDENTSVGVWEHNPPTEGEMTLNVTLKTSGGETLRVLSLTQTVVAPNRQVENLIVQDNASYPVAGNPGVSREVINDFLALIHQIAPVASEEVLNRLLFGITYVEAQDHNQTNRDRLIAHCEEALNGGHADRFFQRAAPGAGICRLRPPLMAMSLTPSLITWEVIPAGGAPRQSALTRIQTALAGLTQDNHVDIFNRLRFPKASLKTARQLLEAIRDRYFRGTNFVSLMANDTQAGQLLEHFKTGPNPTTP